MTFCAKKTILNPLSCCYTYTDDAHIREETARLWCSVTSGLITCRRRANCSKRKIRDNQEDREIFGLSVTGNTLKVDRHVQKELLGGEMT